MIDEPECGSTQGTQAMTNKEIAQMYCENESQYGWYCRTDGCPHCGHIPVTLHEVVNNADLELFAGKPGFDRWVAVRTDSASPSVFGLMHKVTDYTLVSTRPSLTGMVFHFQRNAKPARQDR